MPYDIGAHQNANPDIGAFEAVAANDVALEGEGETLCFGFGILQVEGEFSGVGATACTAVGEAVVGSLPIAPDIGAFAHDEWSIGALPAGVEVLNYGRGDTHCHGAGELVLSHAAAGTGDTHCHGAGDPAVSQAFEGRGDTHCHGFAEHNHGGLSLDGRGDTHCHGLGTSSGNFADITCATSGETDSGIPDAEPEFVLLGMSATVH